EGRRPNAVYAMLHQARWNLDVKTIVACTSERIVINVDDLHEELMRLRGGLPEGLSLQREVIESRVATLFYLGYREDRDAEQVIVSRGRVTMVFEQGVWRMRHEIWEDVRTEPLVREVDKLPRNRKHKETVVPNV
ncbi:MAG: hypothetical protein ACNA71_05760, partial [Kiritimatiellia bacterium]